MLDKDASPENNLTVAVNWLVNFVKVIMHKVNEHAEMIKRLKWLKMLGNYSSFKECLGMLRYAKEC